MSSVVHSFNADYSSNHLLSSLEVSVLTQYQTLLHKLLALNEELISLKNLNSTQLLENLRILETKISLIFTLFKGSVYSLFLQTKQNIDSSGGDAGGDTKY
ncbi:hypothetical protein PACTADRAFT_50132 [Pachysolen tannophilus NRRL Y-2460]|uniref:DASH complex subunit DAD3 n=1 Tax=Pachysolen tannophilus NRRL Y-2460 TaxID=669874 RepID=A0A1E4TUK6_PACTA|nr:hypothetical protein PACTADRAFT_50132 [Pachysolen tannophilus NRRL Y-2460]